MIFTTLIVQTVLMLGLALTGGLALTATGRTRLLSGAAAVGVMAFSQQFLIAAGVGALLVLVGVMRQKSKNPVQKKLGKMNMVAGVALIAFAFYMFY